jgi:nicotinamidase-related amidase
MIPREGEFLTTREGGSMSGRNEDLHGNAPDKADAALLLIDVINDLEFPEGDQLLRHALPMARRIVALKGRAKEAGLPVVYVNDNRPGCPGRRPAQRARGPAGPLRGG